MNEPRHLRSVSDLYAADEIEVLLLEEIRDLEPPLAVYSRPEDIQDFEIAGSRTGRRISSPSSELDSPGIHSTIHSWDSHVNYHGNYGHGDHQPGSSANAMLWPRASHLILYCDIQSHLKSATGLVRLLLLIFSAACLATLCSSGTTKVSLFMLPLVGRLRFMIFVTVFCLLIIVVLLFLDISHIIYVFPFNWSRLNAWTFASFGLSYTTSSVLLALSVFEYHGSGWVPKRTRSQLTASAALGFSSALLSFMLSWLHVRSSSSMLQIEADVCQQLYNPDEGSSSGVTVKEGTWVVKNSKKGCDNFELNNGNSDRSRKDHWSLAQDNFLNISQLNEDHSCQQPGYIATTSGKGKETNIERRRQRRRRDLQNNNSDMAQTSLIINESKKRMPPKKLLQPEDKTRSRGFKECAKKTITRTSVTRSEIQEYWMQGYDHVQRTNKTTANIEQWQSVAMKSLEKKKANDVYWKETWYQEKHDLQLDNTKPSSSKMLEPLEIT